MLILNMVCLTVELAENEMHDQENRGGNEGRNNVQGEGGEGEEIDFDASFTSSFFLTKLFLFTESGNLDASCEMK
jgi:hypothetical protein